MLLFTVCCYVAFTVGITPPSARQTKWARVYPLLGAVAGVTTFAACQATGVTGFETKKDRTAPYKEILARIENENAAKRAAR